MPGECASESWRCGPKWQGKQRPATAGRFYFCPPRRGVVVPARGRRDVGASGGAVPDDLLVFALIGFGVTAKFVGDHVIKPALTNFADRFPCFALVVLLAAIGCGVLLYVLWFGYVWVRTVIYVVTKL